MGKAKRHEVKNIKRLRSHLGECMVLLKKDGSFPLEKAGTIVAYGSGVRHTIKGGTGSGEVNSRYFITVEKGLKRAGFRIINENWLDEYDLIREDNRAAFYKAIGAGIRPSAGFWRGCRHLRGRPQLRRGE